MQLNIVVALAAGVGLAIAVPQVRADQWNQKTDITFSEPVEIPGHVLPPGSYVFKLVNSAADRDVVEVYNKDTNKFYGIFLAVPDYHAMTHGKPIVTFSERPAGSPEAVKAWFYPGHHEGHEFVYPRSEAMKLARANRMPVASMPDEELNGKGEGSASSFQGSHIKAVQPTGKEVEPTKAFGTGPDSTSR
jgi:hypothetical protein